MKAKTETSVMNIPKDVLEELEKKARETKKPQEWDAWEIAVIKKYYKKMYIREMAECLKDRNESQVKYMIEKLKAAGEIED